MSLTHFPNILPTKEKAVGAINEASIGEGRTPLSCFLISYFTVSVILSINRSEFSSGFMILIISPIYSFEMDKANPFPALTAFQPKFL